MSTKKLELNDKSYPNSESIRDAESRKERIKTPPIALTSAFPIVAE